MISAEFCLVKVDASTPEQVITMLSRRLFDAGHVRDSFERAALLREQRSPTGLPFAPPAVALPHAEPEHTIVPTLAIAVLNAAVSFREMGSPEDEVHAQIVVMPAFSAKEQAGASLSRLIELLQDDDLRARLTEARDGAELAEMLVERWTSGS